MVILIGVSNLLSFAVDMPNFHWFVEDSSAPAKI